MRRTRQHSPPRHRLWPSLALVAALMGMPGNAGEPIDKSAPLPRNISIALHDGDSPLADAFVRAGTPQWVGVRKGFIRLGSTRILRLTGCEIEVRSEAGWARVHDWLRQSTKAPDGGIEFEALRISHVPAEGMARRFEVQQAELDPRGRWKLKRISLGESDGAFSVATGTLEWSPSAVVLRPDGWPPLRLWPRPTTDTPDNPSTARTP